MVGKRAWIAVLVLGMLMIVLSLALTVLLIRDIHIVGGVGLPTFLFYFRKNYIWLAEIGALTAVVSLIALLRKKA